MYRATRLLRARALLSASKAHFSSAKNLPAGWEQITRRNGEVVYYNATERKTVREMPGMESNQPKEPAAVEPVIEEQRENEKPVVPHREDPNDEVFVPIDFTKSMKIEGQENQLVHMELKPNQCLRAETGSMIYMTDGVEMETTTAGGFQQGFKRVMTGENFFVSRFIYRGTGSGHVALGTRFPSKIVHLSLTDFIENSIICQKGAFLCGSDTVKIEMEFAKKFGTGFFGGEGFILQRLTGEGDVLIRAGGVLVERDLEPGEVLRISSGCLVGFEPSVAYDVQMLQGVKNMAFGGEGMFLTTLTGPGKVYLQSLPFDRMVGEIASRVPGGGGMGMPIFVGGSGGSGGEGGEGNRGMGDEMGAQEADGSEEGLYGGSEEELYAGGETADDSGETDKWGDGGGDDWGDADSDSGGFFSSIFDTFRDRF